MANSTELELGLENKAWHLAEVAVGFVLNRTALFIFNCGWRLWRLLKYVIFGIRDKRTIYGKVGNRFIFATPEERNQPTCIIGQPGFGKSGEEVNLAIQDMQQGEAGIVIDPHGNPHETDEKKKGAVVKIYERAKNIGRVVFLSVNQILKVIGYNPLFLIGSMDALDHLKDELMNSLFSDCLESGFLVSNKARLLVESAIYFHNCYADWLMLVLGKNAIETKRILQTHQITLNDLAKLSVNNTRLIDLFIQMLSFKGSEFYRPDLVRLWQEIKDKSNFDAGLVGAIGRIDKIVTTTRAQLFFESFGFDVIEERKKGKFVLVDISGLDSFTKSIISKLMFVKIYYLHVGGILKSATRLYIDEAASLAMSKLAEMISEGRKFCLDLVLIIQYKKQFENAKDAIAVREACVNKLYFRSEDPEYNAPIQKIATLPNREFILVTSKGVEENVKTLDMPKVRRSVQISERGADKEVLKKQMMAKSLDIVGYFNRV